MSTEFYNKWQNILEDVEKSKVPVQFIKKIVVRMVGKKQHTINIQALLKQGLEPEENSGRGLSCTPCLNTQRGRETSPSNFLYFFLVLRLWVSG